MVDFAEELKDYCRKFSAAGLKHPWWYPVWPWSLAWLASPQLPPDIWEEKGAGRWGPAGVVRQAVCNALLSGHLCRTGWRWSTDVLVRVGLMCWVWRHLRSVFWPSGRLLCCSWSWNFVPVYFCTVVWLWRQILYCPFCCAEFRPVLELEGSVFFLKAFRSTLNNLPRNVKRHIYVNPYASYASYANYLRSFRCFAKFVSLASLAYGFTWGFWLSSVNWSRYFWTVLLFRSTVLTHCWREKKKKNEKAQLVQRMIIESFKYSVSLFIEKSTLVGKCWFE